MSEQIEIEVGINTQNFQTAINNIQKNLKGLGNTTARIRVDGIEKGLVKLNQSTEIGRRRALTLSDAFKKIGAQKISTASMNDIKEVTREFLRIVKELGPVITLAMNALDRPLRKAVLSMVDLLTQVERANSNFLVLRKVLPIRFFTQLAVNAQRVQTSVKGMAKDFRDFGDRGGKAIVSTKEAIKKLVGIIANGATGAKKFASSINDNSLPKATQSYEKLANSIKSLLGGLQNTSRSVARVTREISVNTTTYQTLAGILSQVKGKFDNLASSTNKLLSPLQRLARETQVVKKSLQILNTTGVATATIAFKGLTATIGILVGSFGRLIGANINKPFQLVTKSANIARSSINGVVGAIAKISTSPIRAVSSTFSSLGNVLSGSIGAITTAIASITTLGVILTRVANGAVANYRKEWKKVISELPQETRQSTTKLKTSLKEVQDEVGLLSEDALPALARALQIGFNSDASIDVLRQASKLAISEITSLEDGVNLLGNTMRSFAGQSLTAEQAVDKLFTASKAGGINLQELSSAIQRIGPDIGSTGLAFDEFAGSLAVLVRSGRLTYSALRDIASLTQAIINPSEQSALAFKALGVEFGRGAIEAQGLSGVLGNIRDATNNNATAMGVLLGSQENLNTAMALGQTEGSALAEAIDRVGDSAGSASEQAGAIDSSFKRAFRRAKVTAEQLMIELGDLMEPALDSINKFITLYTQKIKRAVKLGIQLFKDGNFGEFINLSISVGLDKAWVGFQNFITKSASALYAGVNEAMSQIVAMSPTWGEQIGMVWEFWKISSGKALANTLEYTDGFLNYFIAGYRKTIEEAKELWSKYFGDGSSKARDFTVILKEEVDKASTSRALAYVFGATAKKMEQDLADSLGQGFADNIVPALKAVAEATKKAYESTKGTAFESKETAKNVKKMQELLELAGINLDKADAGASETAKELANANSLLSLPKSGASAGDGFGNIGGSSLGETIASTLQRVGGGGNVMESQNMSMKTLVGLSQQQIQELKLINKGLGEIGLGEVAP